jgi:hypothetical protein
MAGRTGPRRSVGAYVVRVRKAKSKGQLNMRNHHGKRNKLSGGRLLAHYANQTPVIA